jgi:hypothetical protein
MWQFKVYGVMKTIQKLDGKSEAERKTQDARQISATEVSEDTEIISTQIDTVFSPNRRLRTEYAAFKNDDPWKTNTALQMHSAKIEFKKL